MIECLSLFVKTFRAMTTPSLVLASTSPYRAALLKRLGVDFATLSPETDETALPGEEPRALAMRLAEAKARSAAAQWHGAALIIGSDQVAALDGERFGKPQTVDRAIAQLQRMRGQTVAFFTAVAVFDTVRKICLVDEVTTWVTFRADLSDEAIQRYVERERPLDCAGAAKIEALGITLVEKVTSDDPTALIGLPLIATLRLLRHFGWSLP